jgi:hypothetical protein
MRGIVPRPAPKLANESVVFGLSGPLTVAHEFVVAEGEIPPPRTKGAGMGEDEHELLALDSVASQARVVAACGPAAGVHDCDRAPRRSETSGAGDGDRGEAAFAGPLGGLRRAGGILALGFGVVHLLVAAALDLERAAPALAIAVVTALWYASGQPAVRARWQRCFRAADEALLRAYPGRRLGLIATTQLVVVVVAACIVGVTLLQHIQRAGMTHMCVGRMIFIGTQLSNRC